MARLNCEEKLAYYPTDINAVKAFIKEISKDKTFSNFRICDPCCGKGIILELWKKSFKNIKTFGVELDENRGKEAQERVDLFASADAIYGMRKSKDVFDFLFLNPPYGELKTQEANNRLEIEFVKTWVGTISEQGYMLLIINPSCINERMVSYLQKAKMQFVANFFFDNDDHLKFKQYFLLFKKDKNVESQSDLLALISKSNSKPFAEVDFSNVEIPKSNFKERILFETFQELKIWQKEKLLANTNAPKEFWNKLLNPIKNNFISSIQTPNDGQSALLLSAGLCEKDIGGFLIKGYFEKVEILEEEKEDGKVKVKEQFISQTFAFDMRNGEYLKLI